MAKKEIKEKLIKYSLTQEDIQIIEQGRSIVLNKLKDIFARGGLNETEIETFDSKYAYLLTKKTYKLPKAKNLKSNMFNIFVLKHGKKLDRKSLTSGRYGKSRFDKINELLKKKKDDLLKNLYFNLISIAPFGAYWKISGKGKKKQLRVEAYLASYIVHEHGHIYFINNAKPNVLNNFSLFKKLALNSKKAWNNSKNKFDFEFPIFSYIPHHYATLCEYAAAKKLFPKYLKRWHKNAKSHLRFLTKSEKSFKKWFNDKPLLETYYFDLLYVPLIINKWKDWPERLLKIGS